MATTIKPYVLSLTGDQTLMALVKGADILLSHANGKLLRGETLILMTLGDSSKVVDALESLAYWVAQVTVALCRLRCWMATSGFGIGLPAKKLLPNYIDGYAIATGLIENANVLVSKYYELLDLA